MLTSHRVLNTVYNLNARFTIHASLTNATVLECIRQAATYVYCELSLRTTYITTLPFLSKSIIKLAQLKCNSNF